MRHSGGVLMTDNETKIVKAEKKEDSAVWKNKDADKRN